MATTTSAVGSAATAAAKPVKVVSIEKKMKKIGSELPKYIFVFFDRNFTKKHHPISMRAI